MKLLTIKCLCMDSCKQTHVSMQSQSVVHVSFHSVDFFVWNFHTIPVSRFYDGAFSFSCILCFVMMRTSVSVIATRYVSFFALLCALVAICNVLTNNLFLKLFYYILIFHFVRYGCVMRYIISVKVSL